MTEKLKTKLFGGCFDGPDLNTVLAVNALIDANEELVTRVEVLEDALKQANTKCGAATPMPNWGWTCDRAVGHDHLHSAWEPINRGHITWEQQDND